MNDPEASIADIVAYARRALGHIAGLDRSDFLEDARAQDAVIRCLEVIGEAAKRVPGGVRALHPAVPWTQMAGMRNRLTHEYGAVDAASVWVTVTRDLPEIVRHLAPDG